jgi:hypothetical protein
MSRPPINEPYNVPNLHRVNNPALDGTVIDTIEVSGATASDRAKKLLVQTKQLIGAVNTIRLGCKDERIKLQLSTALRAAGVMVDDE